MCVYLIHSEKAAVDSALASMKAVRPYVNPNVGFLVQLREFQKACLGDKDKGYDCVWGISGWVFVRVCVCAYGYRIGLCVLWRYSVLVRVCVCVRV